MSKQEFAKVVQAWAEGEEIQYRIISSIWADKEGWITDGIPNWEPDVEWRIKPQTIRWRVALMRGDDGKAFPTLAYPSYGWDEKDKEPPEFIRWLDSWQEVEV